MTQEERKEKLLNKIETVGTYVLVSGVFLALIFFR
jgi:hypothetical protein